LIGAVDNITVRGVVRARVRKAAGKAGGPRIRAPRQTRSAALVDAVLDATGRLIDAHGMAVVSTKAVARLAGVSPGSLYQYFRSRDALLAAWELRELKTRFVPLRARFLQDITDGVNPEAAMARFGRTAVTVIAKHYAAHGAARGDYVTSLQERMRATDETAAFLVETMTSQPIPFRRPDAELAIRTATHVVGLASYAFATRPMSDAERAALIEELVDMSLRYLLP
jgi:AcrR family transcriptional regulator